jgi:ribonuclease P protein component
LVYYAAEPKKAGMAVVVPKKAVPKAVDRHLVKRRMFAAMRSWRAPGMALVAHARPGIASLPPALLREELAALYARLPRR